MAFYDDILVVFDKYSIPMPPHLAQQLYHLNPPAPAATIASGRREYFVTDGTNGLVKFYGQDSIEHYGTYNYCFEGAKELFDVTSQPWNTIGYNCGELEFEQAHPDFLAGMGVVPMELKTAPGASAPTWQPSDGKDIPNALRLPSHIKTAADALTYLRGLPQPS